jgi:hypothetical protein
MRLRDVEAGEALMDDEDKDGRGADNMVRSGGGPSSTARAAEDKPAAAGYDEKRWSVSFCLVVNSTTAATHPDRSPCPHFPYRIRFHIRPCSRPWDRYMDNIAQSASQAAAAAAVSSITGSIRGSTVSKVDSSKEKPTSDNPFE